MPLSREFPQLIPARLRAGLPRLEALLWTDRRPVPVEAGEPTADYRDYAARREGAWRAAVSGEAWGRLFDQRWFRPDLGAARAGDYLHWGDQGEATLYWEGVPVWGFDPQHTHGPLPAHVGGGGGGAWIAAYCCRTAWNAQGGLSPAGSRFDGAWLVRRDEVVWQAWHDLKCLADLAFFLREDRAQATGAGLDTAYHFPSLESASPLYRQILEHLARALDAWETDGVAALAAPLAAAYADLADASPRLRARAVGNSHIDLVYLWPEKMGEMKALHTFSTILSVMDRYPEARFTYSQPASYEAVARHSPALIERVAARMAEGRWEATGALQVESDMLLPSGEGLVRSFQLGQAAFRRLRGTPARLLWLPDCFGFPQCLPQLMRLAGVEYFFTAKMNWNAINRFPFTSFVWRGADGSEVLAHAPRSSGYANWVDPARLHAGAQSHTQAAVHREFLHPMGYGDGGGGLTEDMCERVRRYARLAGVPPVSWDQPEAFFERMATVRGELPVWRGELYLEYHRGTTTTLAAVKAAYRAAERALQAHEAAAVHTGARPDLEAVWKRLVFHQFHDDLPGTGVPEVYAETLPELELIRATQEAAAQALLGGRAVPGGGLTAFNPLPLPWSGWVEDGAGRRVHLEIPPLATRSLDHGTRPAPVGGGPRGLDNGLVQAEVDATGALAALTIHGRCVELEPGAGRPWIHPDYPANYDAWDIDRHSLDLGRPAGEPVEIARESPGPERAAVRVKWRIGRASTLVQRYVLEGGASCLRIELDLDWQEPQALLKLAFPTRYHGRQARFGAPFGSTLRDQWQGSPEAGAQWEVPASRWAAVAHDGERDGLWLAAEAKYGFRCREGVLEVSLVRSPVQTGFQAHGPLTPRALSRCPVDSIHTDLGRHTIRLAVGLYDAAAAPEASPPACAEALFLRPLLSAAPERDGPFAGCGPGGTLLPSWAQPCVDGSWVLRLHEWAGQASRTRLRLPPGCRATPVNLLEDRLGPDLQEGRVDYRPYQVLSFRVESPHP